MQVCGTTMYLSEDFPVMCLFKQYYPMEKKGKKSKEKVPLNVHKSKAVIGEKKHADKVHVLESKEKSSKCIDFVVVFSDV